MANDTINFITLKWTSFERKEKNGNGFSLHYKGIIFIFHFLQIEGKDLAIDYAPEQTITDAKENNASSTINLCLTKEEVHVTPIMIDANYCAPSSYK